MAGVERGDSRFAVATGVGPRNPPGQLLEPRHRDAGLFGKQAKAQADDALLWGYEVHRLQRRRLQNIVLNAIGPAPVRVTAAEELLTGSSLDDETIEKAAALARKAATPLDNTDFQFGWRRKMVPVFVRRALESLR